LENKGKKKDKVDKLASLILQDLELWKEKRANNIKNRATNKAILVRAKVYEERTKVYENKLVLYIELLVKHIIEKWIRNISIHD